MGFLQRIFRQLFGQNSSPPEPHPTAYLDPTSIQAKRELQARLLYPFMVAEKGWPPATELSDAQYWSVIRRIVQTLEILERRGVVMSKHYKMHHASHLPEETLSVIVRYLERIDPAG